MHCWVRLLNLWPYRCKHRSTECNIIFGVMILLNQYRPKSLEHYYTRRRWVCNIWSVFLVWSQILWLTRVNGTWFSKFKRPWLLTSRFSAILNGNRQDIRTEWLMHYSDVTWASRRFVIWMGDLFAYACLYDVDITLYFCSFFRTMV